MQAIYPADLIAGDEQVSVPEPFAFGSAAESPSRL